MSIAGYEQVNTHRVQNSNAQNSYIYINTANLVGFTKPFTNSFGQKQPLVNPKLVYETQPWYTFWIPPSMPDNVTGLELAGIAIITNPSQLNLAMYIAVRAFGATHEFGPLIEGQALANGGSRDGVSFYAPVSSRRFQLRYGTAKTGSANKAFSAGSKAKPPALPTVAVDLRLVGYTTPA